VRRGGGGGVRGGWPLNAFSDALCVRAMCCEIKCGYRVNSKSAGSGDCIIELLVWDGVGGVLLYVEISESGLWGMVLYYSPGLTFYFPSSK